jgi:hypothetical protein
MGLNLYIGPYHGMSAPITRHAWKEKAVEVAAEDAMVRLTRRVTTLS